MKKLIQVLVLLGCTTVSFGQAASYSDPAAAYQRILLETNNRTVIRQIGPYKVIGTPYLFGPEIFGDLATRAEKTQNVKLSYNTYNQQIELATGEGRDPLVMGAEDVDSFKLAASIKKGFKEDLLFLNSRFSDPSLKRPFFLQLVAPGLKYALFKAYRSELGYAEDNYVQSELRQFELMYDYYYTAPGKPGFKKFKPMTGAIRKEFGTLIETKSFTDTDEFNTDPELALKHMFEALNSK